VPDRATAPGARGASPARLIFAMGGGGFTTEPSNPLLDDYVLSLAAAPEPRILFLPTASGDEGAQITAFHGRFGARVCVPEHLSLFRLREARASLEVIVLGQDIVYVGGGSMRNLLALWSAHGLDDLLCAAWRRGVVLAGLSAGAMCWFEGGVTCSSGDPEPIAGLGLLEGSLTVHADGEPERLPRWLACVRDGRLPGGWALDDGVGLLFAGQQLTRVVSSRPGAGAVRVDVVSDELVRTHLDVELLGEGEQNGAVDESVHELRHQRLMGRQTARGLPRRRGTPGSGHRW
jgi:dipeptidase E